MTILLDGAGQLGGVIYASMVSSKFDARPKHHRFTSALLLHAATLLELVTPLFPQFFVASASISNIAKNVSWLATGATRAAINRTFAVHDNLGDLTAKSGAQSTAAGLIGTALGVVLSYMMPSAHPMALVAAFLPMAAINTYAVHASCRSVVTATLDPQRADLALHSLARALSVGSSDVVPELHGPAQVSERESFVKVPKNGSILLEPPLDMPGLSGFSMGKGHLLAISSKNQPALWFAEQASGRDCVLGYLRALVCSELLKNSASAEEALAKSSDAVEIHGSHVVEGLVKAGWDLDNHFLAEAGRRIRVSA